MIRVENPPPMARSLKCNLSHRLDVTSFHFASMLSALFFLSSILCLIQNAAVAADGAPRQQQSQPAQRYDDQGMAIEFSLSPIDKADRLVAGGEALASFLVRDARSGQPITGLHPKAWINARLSEPLASETSCKDKIRGFLAGQLATRPDIDLNSYLALTLNSDKTIAVINPQVAFNSTKLQNIISLPSNGADWILSRDQELLYVTMPESSSVAIIDTTTKKLVATLSTGDGTQPRRIALQPDGNSVWVGLDGAAEIVVIGTETNVIESRIKVGRGLHSIAFSADSHFAYVTNSSDNTVTAVDVQKRTKIVDLLIDQTPTAIAYGSMSGLFYVAAINGTSVSAIDPDKKSIVAKISVKPGLSALRFDPGGRYALAVNQVTSTLIIIDSATNLIVGSTQVVNEPDQISFTERYAYVRGLGSEKFTLIDLNEMKSGKLNPVDIQAGRQPPSKEPQEIGVADMIAPTPEGNTVMVANAPDRMMYFYQEGMMAPMGTFSNYDRIPRGLMILDRSLHETAPGTYTTIVKLTKGGNFDVPILIDQPRIVNCFRAIIEDAPGSAQKEKGSKLVLDVLKDDKPRRAHQPTNLKFKLTDRVSKMPIVGLKDAQVLIFEPPGVWQQRHIALELGDGVYAIEQTFPHPGFYNLMIAIASLGIAYVDLQTSGISVESTN